MGRKRKPEDEWMPERVYRGKSAFEFRPRNGGTITLCPLSSSKKAVWSRYQEELTKLEMSKGSFQELVDEYFLSPAFKERAASTQKKYKQNSKQPLAVFGKTSCETIKPEHIRKYMDLRGQKAQVTANREKAFMSLVFSWGYERGKVSKNPVKGVKKFTEESRDRYITDTEYKAVLKRADPITAAIMEISYCCAARISDVLSITKEQLKDEGLYIKQGKTGKAQIKAWSPRLTKAIKLAQSSQTTPSITRVVANEDGQKLTYDAFRERWDLAKKTAKKENEKLNIDFTFHDIKAKSISDFDGDKQKFSGHKTAQQVQAYDRKTDVVPSHE